MNKIKEYEVALQGRLRYTIYLTPASLGQAIIKKIKRIIDK